MQALNRHSHVIRVPKSTKTDIDGNPLHKLTIVNLDARQPNNKTTKQQDNQTTRKHIVTSEKVFVTRTKGV